MSDKISEEFNKEFGLGPRAEDGREEAIAYSSASRGFRAGYLACDRNKQWISVDEQLPDIPIGDEMHCFLLLELHHQSNEGKSIVVDGYWANKPADPAWGEDVEAPDWALETEDGDYLNLVGWAELTHHPDFSGYYTAFETTYRKIVAWMPIKYPLAPK